jgi:hypothetical protein
MSHSAVQLIFRAGSLYNIGIDVRIILKTDFKYDSIHVTDDKLQWMTSLKTVIKTSVSTKGWRPKLAAERLAVLLSHSWQTSVKVRKSKAVPLHAMEALRGEEV